MDILDKYFGEDCEVCTSKSWSNVDLVILRFRIYFTFEQIPFYIQKWSIFTSF